MRHIINKLCSIVVLSIFVVSSIVGLAEAGSVWRGGKFGSIGPLVTIAGESTIITTSSVTLGSNNCRGELYTVKETAKLFEGWWYARTAESSYQMRFVVFDSSNVLLAVSDVKTGWKIGLQKVIFTGTNRVVITAGQQVRICIFSNNDLRTYYNTTSNHQIDAGTFPTPPNTFASDGDVNQHFTCYITGHKQT